MKKLINKIGVITFSLSPIVAIASASNDPIVNVSPQFELSQSFITKFKKSFKNSKWIEQTQSNSGSKITDGIGGTIFEDSRGNLWSMASFAPLQRYDYQTKRWTSEVSSGSNITNGFGGTIFEDSRGNLWSMAQGTPLQRYNYQTKRWTSEESSDSNITSGGSGTIFEDSRGSLWSMAQGTPLQKYNYTTKKWAAETNSDNNITNGYNGTIFEDSRGNLWSMAQETLLQKYNYTTKKWVAETSDKINSSGSNITNGWGGTIFEDSRGNLWSMGAGTPLQKYNYQTKRWIIETSESSGNNITNGDSGTIFEDSRGNLWSMGRETPLQKYNYQTKRWTEETSGSSGSNINNGVGGTIFEDSRGNLWSMGRETPLQKYNYQTKRWTAETSGSSGSNIFNGLLGTIFEDSRGNLWSMGFGTPLQKLTPTKETSIGELKLKDFDIEFKTRINKDSKIVLLIKGYKKYTSSLFTHLRYRKKTESSWKIVKKRTLILDAAEYEFKWVLGAEEILASGQKLPQKIIIKSDGAIKISSIQPSDIAKVKAFLKTLSSEAISSLANNSKLVGAITKLEVLKLIQAANGYSELTIDQQALIAEDLISLSEDPPGTLKATITFKGITSNILKVTTKLINKDISGLSTRAIVGTILGSIFGMGIIGLLIFYLVRRNKKKSSKK